MSNDHACQMVEIGTIWIKIFDGIARELTEMRYVLQMKKILSQLELWSQRVSK